MVGEFNEFYFKTRLSDTKRRFVVWKQISKYLKKYVNGTVVDIGCGHADFLRFSLAKKKIGIDVFKSEEFPKDSLFIKSNAMDFDKKVKTADVVFASNLLEHFNDNELDKTMASIMRVLEKDGLLILVQPNFKYFYKSYFDDYTHKKIFTEVSLCDYLKSKGFEIVKCYPKFLPATLKSRLPAWSFLVWVYLRSPIKPFAGQMLVIARKK